HRDVCRCLQFGEKEIQEVRVELHSTQTAKFGNGGVGVPRRLVRTLRGQRVVDIRDRDDPRLERDVRAPQAMRIPAAVPGLVMVQRDSRRTLKDLEPAALEYPVTNDG